MARLGGDEFAAILVNNAPSDGRQWFARLNHVLEQQATIDPAGPVPSLSAGMAFLDGDGDSVEAAMQRADAALYAAKTQGRNRLEIAGA